MAIDPDDIKTYAELRQHLGDTILCYGETTGCVVDDETNERVCCETGCLLLQIYRKGYRAGKSGATNSEKA
jgi:hypothetical protein